METFRVRDLDRAALFVSGSYFRVFEFLIGTGVLLLAGDFWKKVARFTGTGVGFADDFLETTEDLLLWSFLGVSFLLSLPLDLLGVSFLLSLPLDLLGVL